ncbi:hypothetical protein LTR47_005939 [Exophiala xenobiotica]|nr:hypothetical protein LTR47_005939 [Exophiala xenobiotica]KAK5247529.1 hypothetical protein LTS06_007334 [Exophiala xenobiotica]KAK5259314.1 hypothetical protein LTR40_006216 [Exophiala xenobiotica]KAK5322357.1 hypothetical protein LTR93_005560 [Exophiala xenobiotica]KAK5350883.1 hypothetical protein LTR61_005236 [Exophiala xenobiotica]
MARHVLERRLPGQVLLAVSSLCQDMDSGHQHPSSTTITLMLESIHRLKEQLEKPDGVGDDTILAMTNLWVYEAVLAMGRVDMPGQKPTHNPGASQQSIQTHVDGLQRSIKHVGGLSRLSPEAMWSVAWCVGNLPGYSPIDTPVVNGSNPSMEPRSIGSYCSVTRLLDFLAKIQRLASSPYFQPSMLHEKSFVTTKQTLLRLVQMDTDPKTPLRRLMRSTALVSILLLIFDILLGGSDKGVQGPKERRVQMMQAQDRLREHNIDQEGSPQQAWQVLMTQAETPNLQLHPRSWSVVGMVNVIKHLSMSTMGSLSQLLLEWLLPETCEHAEGFRYERILLKIHYELDGLGSLP